jgi:hypothetical protein
MMVASSTKHKKRWGLPKGTQKTTGEHKEKPNPKKNRRRKRGRERQKINVGEPTQLQTRNMKA